jgi:SagB-type dehydrogenase family enzyme
VAWHLRAGLFLALSAGFPNSSIGQDVGDRVQLAPARLKGSVSLEEALHQRRSVRSFAATPLGLEDVAQVLWAAQGVTHPLGYRTAPSAGALQPLVIYLLAGKVVGLAPGVYRYRPGEHALVLTRTGDWRGALAASAPGQRSVQEAPAVLLIAADYQRTAQKYGTRAQRYVHIEAGHAAQNVYLQATALGLSSSTLPERKYLISLETGFKAQTTKLV